MKRLKRKAIFIYVLTVVGLISFFAFDAHDLSVSVEKTYQVLYQVQDVYESELLAVAHDLEMVSISDYGIVTYLAKDETHYQSLLDIGFFPNATYESSDLGHIMNFDPYYNDQYALDVMDVYQAWSYTEGSSDVVIAVIDSGIDTDHEEFANRLSEFSYNALTKQIGLAYVEDDNGHGTAVTGVIAANKDNRKGIAGIVQHSTILVIKANNVDNPDTVDEDESRYFSDTAIIEGIYYATDFGADVINMSLGGSYPNPLTRTAIQYARDKGVIIIAASGNLEENEEAGYMYPASFEDVISVGATNASSVITDFSNYNDLVDVSAPGDDIITTAQNDQYQYISGTSLAAPQVTGIAGLLISYYPDMSRAQIIDRLMYGSIDQGELGLDDYYGYGVVNAHTAFNIILDYLTVSFDTDGGTLIDSIDIYKGTSISITDPYKEGHDFNGWYQDSLFEQPFEMGVDFIFEDVTLYAQFIPKMYAIHFVTAGNAIADIEVPYGQAIDLPETSRVGYTFVGWYKDANYKVLYNNEPVTGSMYLYAKFTILMHQVTFYVSQDDISTLEVQDGDTFDLFEPTMENMRFDGWFIDSQLSIPYVEGPLESDLDLYAKFIESYYTVTFHVIEDDVTTLKVNAGATFDLFEPIVEGQVFIGWYLDADFSEPYLALSLEKDIDLYAKFHQLVFQVQFIDADLSTVIQTEIVNYGHAVIALEQPTKERTPSFIYSFIGWSESFDFVTSDLVIYPIFEKIYQRDSIWILPGVDTIEQDTTWIDGTIHLEDALLRFVMRSEIDTSQVGRHLVLYDIYEEDVLMDTKVRVVRVVEPKETIIITLNPDVTTIVQGDVYVDQGATTSHGELVVKGEVDTQTTGIYVLTYTVEYNNQIVSKSKYIYVLGNTADNSSQVAYYKKEEDGWYM